MSAGGGEQKSDEQPLSQRPHVTIYTDGAAEPNPGQGGYGVVLLHPAKRLELSKGFELTTNNRMELLAVIAGLEKLTKPCRVTVYSDSKYVVNAIDKGKILIWQKANWFRTRSQRAKNPDLWERYLIAAATHEVKLEWIKGHAGHEHNERCDELAGEAARGPKLEVDVGYLSETQRISTVTTDGSESLQKVSTSTSKVKHRVPGEPCRNCGTPLVKAPVKRKKRKPGQTHYYEWLLRCNGCKAIYLVEEAMRLIESDQKSMFDSIEE